MGTGPRMPECAGSHKPHDAWAQPRRVVVALALGQPAQAVAAAQAALAALLLGEHSQAGMAVSQALTADPHGLEALAGLSNNLVKLGAPARRLRRLANKSKQTHCAVYCLHGRVSAPSAGRMALNGVARECGGGWPHHRGAAIGGARARAARLPRLARYVTDRAHCWSGALRQPGPAAPRGRAVSAS